MKEKERKDKIRKVETKKRRNNQEIKKKIKEKKKQEREVGNCVH